MVEATPAGPGAQDRLDSWKQIAAHIKRGVTTVQRWEKDEGLPVHRLAHSRSGSVYAWPAEIDAWWRRRSETTFGEAGRPESGMRLLVLPFANLGTEPDLDHLGDGLLEELITQIARGCSPFLSVIARTSAMAYKGSGKSVREISDALRLDYVIEGSIRRAGNRLRIAVQLIDARDETHRWAGVREALLGDLLALEAEVAETVAAEVKVVLSRPRRHPGSIGLAPTTRR